MCVIYICIHAYSIYLHMHTLHTRLIQPYTISGKTQLTLPLATSEERKWVAEGQGWEADFSLHNTSYLLALNFVQLLSIEKEILKQAAIRHASSSSPSH